MKTKKMDDQIEQAYYKIADRHQIGIMDIPTVFTESRRSIVGGATVDQAVRAAVLMYCREAGS